MANAQAQQPQQSQAAPQQYTYTLDWDAPNTHTYIIELATEAASGGHTDFRLPAWRPGRYFMQNYAAGVSGFEAYSAEGQPLSWRKVDKDTWRVLHDEQPGQIRIRYRYYAAKIDAGSSYYSKGRAYFNPINMFMHRREHLNTPCVLKVPELPAKWDIATALTQEDATTFSAASYHDLIDSPTVFGEDIKRIDFEVDGKQMQVHFVGYYHAPAAADKQIKEDFTKMIREQTAVFGELPLQDYHFIYLLVPFQLRHAVEHKYSAMFVLPERVAESESSLQGIYGITSHEFWHVWNVKRIRPAAMWPYDYAQEAYTRLHWFTEGVTDYYAYLTLTRAGLWSEQQLLDHFSRLLTQIENSYSTQVTSPAEASFNSWLMASNYNHPHHQASYYGLGTRVGLLLDLHIRNRTGGEQSLDDVFRYLYQEYYKQDKGVPEGGVQQAAETLVGASFEDFFQEMVYTPGSPDYSKYLSAAGLTVDSTMRQSAPGYEKVGIRGLEQQAAGYRITQLPPATDAFEAGLAEGDLLESINGKNVGMMDKDSLFANLKAGQEIPVSVRRGRDVLQYAIQYTGKSVPRDYQLKKQQASWPKPTADWLSSKQ